MNRRVEFSLNMDNPQEAALYDALADLLRHRRAGEVIRQALSAYLFDDTPSRVRPVPGIVKPRPQRMGTEEDGSPTDARTTSRIVSQSAEMFGF